MANILDGICSEGAILDGLDYLQRSGPRKEWLLITRRIPQDTIADMKLDTAEAEVFEAFRGRPASTEALIRHSGLVAAA